MKKLKFILRILTLILFLKSCGTIDKNEILYIFEVKDTLNFESLAEVDSLFFHDIILNDYEITGFGEYNKMLIPCYDFSSQAEDSLRINYLSDHAKNYRYFILDTVEIFNLIKWVIILKYSFHELYDIQPNIELYGYNVNPSGIMDNMFKLSQRAEPIFIVSELMDFRTIIYKDSLIKTIETWSSLSDIIFEQRQLYLYDTIETHYRLMPNSEIRFVKSVEKKEHVYEKIY